MIVQCLLRKCQKIIQKIWVFVNLKFFWTESLQKKPKNIKIFKIFFYLLKFLMLGNSNQSISYVTLNNRKVSSKILYEWWLYEMLEKMKTCDFFSQWAMFLMFESPLTGMPLWRDWGSNTHKTITQLAACFRETFCL